MWRPQKYLICFFLFLAISWEKPNFLASRWENKDIFTTEAQAASNRITNYAPETENQTFYNKLFKVSLVFSDSCLGMFQMFTSPAYTLWQYITYSFLLLDIKFKQVEGTLNFSFLSKTRHRDQKPLWKEMQKAAGGCFHTDTERISLFQVCQIRDLRWAPSAWFVEAEEPQVPRWGAEMTPAASGRHSWCPPVSRRRCSPWSPPLGPLPWRNPERRSCKTEGRNVKILWVKLMQQTFPTTIQKHLAFAPFLI